MARSVYQPPLGGCQQVARAGRARGRSQQGKVTMFRYSLVCLFGLWAAAPALASPWADGLFDDLGRDFGAVPRGPLLTHPFRLVNNTGAAVHIGGVRVSCGCTLVRALQYDLAPGQETVILAQMDTTRFLGSKLVTIFVTFDQPRFDEVRLWVQANSRDDVTVMPNTLAMGRVKRTMSPTASTTISFLGNANWLITGIASESNYIQPVCKMVRRDGFEVAYQLTARVRPDTPVGKWYTDLWLTTNNPATPRVRVPLTVDIESALTISPETVVLGQVKAGKEAERKVIVRGLQPFRITRIQGTDKQLAVRDSTPAAKEVHVLTVTLHGNQLGAVSRTFRVSTDLLGENDLEFTAQAQVIP
jgi:Protein of unknown function (DUF1573)